MLGLALDGLARVLFGAGPSPLAQLARCAAAPFKPKFRPGVPKQFAAACGTFMVSCREGVRPLLLLWPTHAP